MGHEPSGTGRLGGGPDSRGICARRALGDALPVLAALADSYLDAASTRR
jgi:hypothetical protein